MIAKSRKRERSCERLRPQGGSESVVVWSVCFVGFPVSSLRGVQGAHQQFLHTLPDPRQPSLERSVRVPALLRIFAIRGRRPNIHGTPD